MLASTGLFIALLLVALDQFTKFLAFYFGIVNFYDWFYILPKLNSGIAFSLLEKSAYLVSFGIGIFGLAIGIWALGYGVLKPDKFSKQVHYAGYILLAGGALGNSIDRLLFFSVRDFLYFNMPIFNHFIFNLADIYLNLALIILIYYTYTKKSS